MDLLYLFKNEALIENRTSLKNLWQRTIIFSNTHWCSLPNGSVCSELAKSAVGEWYSCKYISQYDRAVGVGVRLLCIWITGLAKQHHLYFEVLSTYSTDKNDKTTLHRVLIKSQNHHQPYSSSIRSFFDQYQGNPNVMYSMIWDRDIMDPVYYATHV